MWFEGPYNDDDKKSFLYVIVFVGVKPQNDGHFGKQFSSTMI